MFCANKNSYLQLVCSINPRIINHAVEQAIQKRELHRHVVDLEPEQSELEPMQPSLYCPHVDITQSNVGYGRIGLRILNRDILSRDSVVQLQALHCMEDQVQIAENAIFLIKLNIVSRLIDIMRHDNPIIREKVCLIFTRLAVYYDGRKKMLIRTIIIDNLIWLATEDIQEIRYAAAYTMWTLSKYLCGCETLMKNVSIVETLLKKIENEYLGIVVIHLKTLANLTEQDEERTIRGNAYRILQVLFHATDERLVAAAMDVMAQICKHEIGKELSEDHSITWKMTKYLNSPHVAVVDSAVGILQYATLTARAKLRAREFGNDITNHLVHLCHTPNAPQLQLKCMQVLINLCDSPDIKDILKDNCYREIKDIPISDIQAWNAGENSSGLDTEHYDRPTEEVGDSADAVNVHNYTRKLHKLKAELVKVIESKPYKD